MIPKHIIEKAIAGGWLPLNPLKVHEHQNALDPEFWSALGKEMGWKGKIYHEIECVAKEYSCYEETSDDTWHYHAFRFCDIILRKAQQEEIDTFWKSL